MSTSSKFCDTIKFIITIIIILFIGSYGFLFMFGFCSLAYEDYFGDMNGVLSQSWCEEPYDLTIQKTISCNNETVTIINKRYIWFSEMMIPERLCDVQTSDGEWWRVNGYTYDLIQINKSYYVRHDNVGFRLWLL